MEKENKKNRKMRKIENKIAKLTEKNSIQIKSSTSKKIMKLEKKKAKLEKWLKIKLPFRFLIKTGITWLILGGLCYGCSYVPILKEVKMVAMAGIAYVAPEPIVKVLDVITLNIGVNNNDFEWLKNTVEAYINEEKEIETNNADSNVGTGYIFDGETTVYKVEGREVSQQEYEKYVKEQSNKLDNMVQEVLGTTDANEISSLPISQIIMKVATNSTPEIISQFLDIVNLTTESRQILEQDINKALKIIPKLNNNQMNEIVDIILDAQKKQHELIENAQAETERNRNQMEQEQREMEKLMQQQGQQYKNQ